MVFCMVRDVFSLIFLSLHTEGPLPPAESLIKVKDVSALPSLEMAKVLMEQIPLHFSFRVGLLDRFTQMNQSLTSLSSASDPTRVGYFTLDAKTPSAPLPPRDRIFPPF